MCRVGVFPPADKSPPPGASRHPPHASRRRDKKEGHLRASFARLDPLAGYRYLLRHARPCAGHPRPFADGREERGWPGRCAKLASRFPAMTTESCSAAVIASVSEAIHLSTGKKAGLLRRKMLLAMTKSDSPPTPSHCARHDLSFLSLLREAWRGTERKRPRSERDAEAALGAGGAALVGHRHALERAEQRDVLAGVIVDARAEHRADGAAAARRREGEVLPEQHRPDRGVTDTLQRDDAAMHVRLERLLAAEACDPGQIKFAALLEVLQGAAGHVQRLGRTGFVGAVELAGDIAQPRGRRQHVVVAEAVAETIGDLRADEPAVIARARGLSGPVIEHQPARLIGGAAALQGEIDKLGAPFEAAVAAAEHVIGVHGLRVHR